MLEGDNYTRIIPGDCISHFGHPSEKNMNIEAACETNRKIVNWVKVHVLRYNDLERRADCLGFFVRTAEESRKLASRIVI